MAKKSRAPPAPVAAEDADVSDDGSLSEDEDEDEEEDVELAAEAERRAWSQLGNRERSIKADAAAGVLEVAKQMGIDDLSSDDEEPGNTIGRVPLHWYEGYDHIGYDVGGEKVIPERSDLLDAALAAADGSAAWTVYDKLNGRAVTLTAREMETIRRIQGGAFGSAETEMYPDYVDYVTYEKEVMPIYGGQYEPKRRFIPSKWEAMRVKKLVNGLKEGRLLTRADLAAAKAAATDPEVAFRAFADGLWAGDDEEEERRRKGPMHIAAPKKAPPGHIESYNPPEEYLEEEREEDGFVPSKHSSLRQVRGYDNFVQERFDRCLDLYLCPRAFKRRLNIDPETLVPQLPKPAELKPFPNTLARTYAHAAGATPVAVSCSPDGQWLATADDGAVVRVFEVATARCVHTRSLGVKAAPVHALRWNPSKALHVLAVAANDGVYVADASTARTDDAAMTAALLAAPDDEKKKKKDDDDDEPKPPPESGDEDEENRGVEKKVATWRLLGAGCLFASLPAAPLTIAWHHGGDYVVSVSPSANASRQVVVHRVSRRESQAPLKRAAPTGGAAQTACFHPTKPFLFVATRTAVRVYHLQQQVLVKTLTSGCKWISTIDVHPSGDHVLVGSCDRRVCWFDLDLGNTPYKTLKYHDKALRAVAYHERLPLMASAADDGHLHIFHAMVYSDLMRSPLIVPVKKLQNAHPPTAVTGTTRVGALACDFHPTQPWIFSCGGDNTVKLFHAI